LGKSSSQSRIKVSYAFDGGTQFAFGEAESVIPQKVGYDSMVVFSCLALVMVAFVVEGVGNRERHRMGSSFVENPATANAVPAVESPFNDHLVGTTPRGAVGSAECADGPALAANQFNVWLTLMCRWREGDRLHMCNSSEEFVWMTIPVASSSLG